MITTLKEVSQYALYRADSVSYCETCKALYASDDYTTCVALTWTIITVINNYGSNYFMWTARDNQDKLYYNYPDVYTTMPMQGVMCYILKFYCKR